MVRLKAVRQLLKNSYLSIAYNNIIIKIVARALKEFPIVNAGFYRDYIRLHKRINIGVAVAIEEGLVVPVLKNADQKSLSEISREAAELAHKARNKRLLPSDYEGGTFTITNLGMFGAEGFHPIINPPESAILALGAIIPKPVVIEGEVAIRSCLKLSLAVDHRVIDGAVASQFLSRIKELIETPAFMLA